MNICAFLGKNVKIVTTDEKNIEGYVIAFTDSDEGMDTDPNGDSISVENKSGIVGIYEKEIKTIEITT